MVRVFGSIAVGPHASREHIKSISFCVSLLCQKIYASVPMMAGIYFFRFASASKHAAANSATSGHGRQ
jgi:hypothetical protein